MGDIYFICKPETEGKFIKSLKFDFEKRQFNPFDNKLCISFNKNDINIVQIKAQNNNQQSAEEECLILQTIFTILLDGLSTKSRN